MSVTVFIMVKRSREILCGLLLCGFASALHAQELKITIPLRSELTPVQRLNQEGVAAVVKRHYEKAEGFFYKAYLFDPADPFTLNNLGYVSELQGQVDRAERFYQLATEQDCYATIDSSTDKLLKGRPMMDALGGLKNLPMRVNRMNVLGTQLLAKERNFEAEAVFKQALAIDPKNAFTLNNLGVAEEATGNWDDALKYYDESAATHSKAPVVITSKFSSRGKPVSAMAANSSQELKKRMEKMTAAQIRATMLTIRGVYATNQNDWKTAKQDFLEASTLAPNSGFALNNLGYVAEREGDLETAKSFYARALRAQDSEARVGTATEASAQGRHLSAIADDSEKSVGTELDAVGERRRGQQGPIVLKRRGAAAAAPDATPVSAQPAAGSSAPSVQPAQPVQPQK